MSAPPINSPSILDSRYLTVLNLSLLCLFIALVVRLLGKGVQPRLAKVVHTEPSRHTAALAPTVERSIVIKIDEIEDETPSVAYDLVPRRRHHHHF